MSPKQMLSESLRSKYLRCQDIKDLSLLNASGIKDDAVRYTQLAKELSVNDTAIINTENFLIDPRVSLKCRVPFCRHYGTCLNCPPHTSNLDENTKTINSYRTGILLCWEFPRKTVIENLTDMRRSLFTTISAIESAAFYDGYYFACGFGTGSCRSGLCNNKECQALTNPEKGCRYPLLARPSMEAMGFDVYGMATKAGWKISPAGGNCPDQIKTLHRVGLVLIA